MVDTCTSCLMVLIIGRHSRKNMRLHSMYHGNRLLLTLYRASLSSITRVDVDTAVDRSQILNQWKQALAQYAENASEYEQDITCSQHHC